MSIRFTSYDLYNNFYGKVYSNADFEASRNDRNNKILIDFYMEVSKTVDLHLIDERWIFKYLTYQFDYYIGKKTEFNVPGSFNQVFAVAAWKRYQSISPKFSWYNAKKKLAKCGVIQVVKERVVSVDYLAIKTSEELEKSRFGSGVRRLAHCIEYTTLYNHRSTSCVSCSVKSQCKSILKSNYKTIYLKRGYEAR